MTDETREMLLKQDSDINAATAFSWSDVSVDDDDLELPVGHHAMAQAAFSWSDI